MSKTAEEKELELNQLKLVESLQKELWRTSPMDWLADRLQEDPLNFQWSKREGYKNHTWDGDIDPLANAWQTIGDAYNNVRQGYDPEYRYVGIEAATGTSKTYWLARLVFWFLDCYENSLVVTSAPKQDQLKLGLWAEISRIMPKIKRVRPEAELFKLRLAMDNSGDMGDVTLDDAQNVDAWHAVGFVAGVGAEETSSNKARGFHRSFMLIILEEATGMPLPTLTAFQNTSTGMTNFIVAVGNPDNEFDPLHLFCQQSDVKNFRISAFDYPNIVENAETFSGAVTNVSIKSRTDVYGEGSPLWNAMVRGMSPTQSKDSLIKLEWVDQCINGDPIDMDLDDSYNAIGIDVANSVAGDKAAVAYGNKCVLLDLREFQCSNATHLAYNIFMGSGELISSRYTDYGIPTMYEYDVEPDCIGIDAVGVGVATVNAFTDNNMDVVPLSGGCWNEAIPTESRREGGVLKEKPMYKFSTLRAQMYWEAREDLRLNRVRIQLADKNMELQLKKELCIPKVKNTSGGIEVESKPDIKKRLGNKSPNVADAFVYWNWVRKGYRIERYGFAAMSGG